MKISDGLTFDDVLLVPGASRILPNEADIRTQVTKKIHLNIPLLSSAMDTVTEKKMAIAMAQSGGLGVIHRNLSIEDQASIVADVKRFESGVIFKPITLRPGQKLKDARQLQEKYNITGFPVVGKSNILLGIVTNRDMRFAKDENTPVENMMTKKSLAIVDENFEISKARKMMEHRRIEKLLVVNQKKQLTGLLTFKDLEQSVLNPNACKDGIGRLRVAAASTVGKAGFDRSKALVEAGVDLVVIDTAHGHAESVLNAVEKLKLKIPEVEILAGNVATGAATEALIERGADSVKVGIGPGSICTTRIIAGVGVPQLTAIINCVEFAAKIGIPVIADGGIKYSGDFSKAIAAGANCAMVGSMLAGTDEAPGEIVLYKGRSFKAYRGMGSLGAMARGSADRYFQQEVENDKLVPEGVEGQVSYKGPAINVLNQLTGGLKAAMGYTGNKDVEAMKRGCEFVKISNAGLAESHVHDINITREAPNYRTAL